MVKKNDSYLGMNVSQKEVEMENVSKMKKDNVSKMKKEMKNVFQMKNEKEFLLNVLEKKNFDVYLNVKNVSKLIKEKVSKMKLKMKNVLMKENVSWKKKEKENFQQNVRRSCNC
ncbi:MAG: hypothetical protein EZS28_029754 [Streblomastix strix]|uniref:Uncharacterized protein n=1 Tax=Streblomastix strix TaxID=222440 RepID=A0A5J4UW93_9EUKA|nr:MAG: hypothetical protein EZS28_029754 [Streblomastix strix]